MVVLREVKECEKGTGNVGEELVAFGILYYF